MTGENKGCNSTTALTALSGAIGKAGWDCWRETNCLISGVIWLRAQLGSLRRSQQ